MAMVYHELYCEGIKEKIIGGGFVGEKVLKSKSAPKGRLYPFVLDYGKCNPEEWEKEKEKILKDGVVDYGRKSENGEYGARRDYTAEEQAELGFYPVQFSEDGNRMSWLCRWIPNEDISFYTFTALPDEVMILTESYEGSFDFGCYLKNGNNFAELPKVNLIGADGNIFSLTGIASQALRKAGLSEQAERMQKRITNCNSYEEAISVIADYVMFEDEKREDEEE